MLNPELQENINLEIEKSNPDTADFLKDKYFRDTIDMISRVNKLTPEQSESLELETVLFILKLSEYANFYDAVLSEVFPENISVENEEKLKTNIKTKQISSDIESYIFVKLKEEEAKPKEVFKEVKEGEYDKKDQFDNLDSILKSSTKNLREEIKEKLDDQNAFNLLKINPNIKKLELEKPATVPNIIIQSEPIDFYKEKVDDVDKVIKKEIDVVYNKDN